MGYIAYAIPVFLLSIALEAAAARARGERLYALDDSIANLGTGVLNQLAGLLLAGAVAVVYGKLYALAPFPLREGSAAGWIAGFFAVELAYYWNHRFSHEVNVLWAVHVVHHQSEEYNLSVALRQAALSGLSSWPFYAPIGLLGVPPKAFYVMAAVSQLYQFWIHTRLIGRLGPLEAFLNTPSHHRVHHGRNPQYIDRNYGAILIVWDRLFGTFEPEGEAVDYGVKQPPAGKNPVWANVDYWAELWRLTREARNWSERLLVWLKYPGWRPTGAAPTPAFELPDTARWAMSVALGGLVVSIAALFLLYFVPRGPALTAGACLIGALVLLLGRALDEAAA